MQHTRSRLTAVALMATLIAACGGGGDTAESTTTAAPTTTEAATTTSSTSPAPTTTEAASTTTEAPAEPVMPLTGQPITDPAKAERPALVVKIDNHPQARPQFGLNSADMVYEENVEKLTRFAVVFQSLDSDPVGPIRSGRTQDIALLGSLNQPLFAWSGGNATSPRPSVSSDLVDLSPSSTGNDGGFFRNNRNGEDREHTLYPRTAVLYTLTPEGHGPPPQQFTYRGRTKRSTARPPRRRPRHGRRRRELDVGRRHGRLPAVPGRQAAQRRTARPGDHRQRRRPRGRVPAEPRRRPQPRGADRRDRPGWVFTGGVMIEGTWTRDDRLEPFQLLDSKGAVPSPSPRAAPGSSSPAPIRSPLSSRPGGRATRQRSGPPRADGYAGAMSSNTAASTGTYRGQARSGRDDEGRRHHGRRHRRAGQDRRGRRCVRGHGTRARAGRHPPRRWRRPHERPGDDRGHQGRRHHSGHGQGRIGHFVEAQILEALGVDYIDESEVLTPADETHHIDKFAFTVPFVCGATNLGEALRRISEGACMIRSKGEAGTGNIVEAVRHLRNIIGDIRKITQADAAELFQWAKQLQAPLPLVQEIAETGKLPVPLFCAGGIATPADAALAMQLGAEAVFVGSGIFKSDDPSPRAKAIVEATTHFRDADILAKVSLASVPR